MKLDQRSLASTVRDAFVARHAAEPRVFVAPGRVNLIGEHIDYCAGSVLPFAIDRGTWVALRPRNDRRVRATSLNVEWSGEDSNPATVEASIGELDAVFDSICTTHDVERAAHRAPGSELVTSEVVLDAFDATLGPRRWGWAAYPFGVVALARRDGLDVGGFDLLVAGNVPSEAGLSSSASLEVATAFALAETFAWELDLAALADLAWRTETQFVGLPCGIMDQFAVALGERDHALLLDCAKRSWKHVAMPGNCELLVVDSCRPRALIESAYEERVRECEAAWRILRAQRGAVGEDSRAADLELAHATIDQVDQAREVLGDSLWQRARHVASEAERVRDCVRAMEQGDIAAMGRALNASHASLRDDYEVSCLELDALCDVLSQLPGVHGARLTGAGFGGCVIALQEPGALSAERFTALARDYEERFGFPPRLYEIHADDGPRECVVES